MDVIEGFAMEKPLLTLGGLMRCSAGKYKYYMIIDGFIGDKTHIHYSGG